MDVFFIYGLVDEAYPDEIRYVGQTAALYKRWKAHRYNKFPQAWAARAWKASVAFFGRKVEVRLLEVVYGNRQDARGREQFHIHRLMTAGHRLMNGEAWSRRRRAVPSADRFIMLLIAFHDLLDSKTDPMLRGMRRMADVIDRWEKDQPELLTCGKTDCFESRLCEIRRKRMRRVDRLSVSR